MAYLGVSIKGSDINLAAIDRSPGQVGNGLPLKDGFERQSYPGDTSDPTNLLELTRRIRQDMKDWSIEAIVLIDTTKYANWTYSHAQSRVLCIAAVMFAAGEESISFEIVRPSTVGGHLLSPKLEQLDHVVLGFPEAPKYWATGGREAYAAAAYAARDR